MSEIPEDIMDAAESIRVNYVIPDPAEVRLAIAEAILAERERHDWQPIDTAPLNAMVLTIQMTRGDFEGHCEVMRCFDPETKFWLGRFGMMPTHWMPLPSPPKQ